MTKQTSTTTGITGDEIQNLPSNHAQARAFRYVAAVKIIAGIVGIIGLLAIAAAIVYYTVPAHSLPSILGTLHIHTKAKRVKRGESALIVGIVLLVISAILLFVDIRQARRRAAY
ncbi:MAG: hypothetical protein ACRD6W_10760 [Nitrososphaerales archaeon]